MEMSRRLPASQSVQLALGLVLYVVIGTLVATMTFNSPHHDMLETWAWGQNLALGYHKHPPLSGWMAGLWFRVMPRDGWSFHLLAYANAAVGLWAVWLAAGRLLSGRTRLAAVLLLLLTPFFTFSPAKFNANTVLLSAWPWTVYLFILSLERRTLVSGLLLGVAAAAAMLGKYYSVLLLVSCLAAALLHPAARAYFRSPAPYAAVAALLVAVAPHAAWLVANEYQTVTYAVSKTRPHLSEIVGRGTWAMFAGLALHLPAAVALVMVTGMGWREAVGKLRAGVLKRDNAWLVVLALGPYLLTYVACIVGHVRISLQFMIPIFFLWPMVLLRLLGAEVAAARLRVLNYVVAAAGAAAIATAPAVSLANIRLDYPVAVEPRRQVAKEATRLWHQKYGRSLGIVGGTQGYAEAISFFSPDAPVELVELNYRYAPWVTPALIAREGALYVCDVARHICIERARELAGSSREEIERTFHVTKWGVAAPPRTVLFVFSPPPD